MMQVVLKATLIGWLSAQAVPPSWPMKPVDGGTLPPMRSHRPTLLTDRADASSRCHEAVLHGLNIADDLEGDLLLRPNSRSQARGAFRRDPRSLLWTLVLSGLFGPVEAHGSDRADLEWTNSIPLSHG